MYFLTCLGDLLLPNPLLLLFAVMGLGYILGRVRIGSFRLGVAAVLFVGLAFGALHPDLQLPEFVYHFGLVLFVYTIGLASGPSFFASFQRNGLRDNVMGAGLLGVAGLVAAALGNLLHLRGTVVAGLFAGSLTNTPALAGVLETLGPAVHGAAAGQLLAEPVVGYSLAYPFGVIGVILAIHLFSSLWCVDFAQEMKEHGQVPGRPASGNRDPRYGAQSTPGQAQRVLSRDGVYEIDFFSFSLGIVLGLVLGLVTIPLPGGMSFRLGFAGGPLLVALFLGKVQRSGPLVWTLPQEVNHSLRQLGLILFLAGIGTRAGYAFASTFRELGPLVVLASLAITFTYSACTLLLGHKVLRIPMATLSGLLSGLQTQPAALAYANDKAGSDLPNVGYATVYPTAMVVKIILAQVLLKMFGY